MIMIYKVVRERYIYNIYSARQRRGLGHAEHLPLSRVAEYMERYSLIGRGLLKSSSKSEWTPKDEPD